jgi:lipoprotein-releasing system permease protein
MWFLSLRHLLSRKRQTFFIFFGVVLGTMVYVFIAGTQLGFQEYFIEQIVENDAHVKISGREEIIETSAMNEVFYKNQERAIWIVPPGGKRDEARVLYPQGWFLKLAKDPDVAAFSEQMTTQVIVSKSGVKTNGVLVGILPEKQKRVTIIDKFMEAGRLTDIGTSGNRLVAGDGLLKKLGAKVGDTLRIATTGTSIQPFKIVGSFHLGVQNLDESFMYGALRDVQQLSATPGRITQIAVRLNDVTLAKDVASRWAINAVDKVQSWDQANASFLQVFQIQDLFRSFITIGILVVAGFGIYNVLSIIVTQKKREIAILRSLGYTPSQILNLFLIQGILIGLTGAVVGLSLGFLTCYGLTLMDFEFAGRRGLTVSFSIWIYIQGFFMAFASSVIASLIPALSASKMTPIEIIRQEAG